MRGALLLYGSGQIEDAQEVARTLARIMHHTTRFLQVMRADARRHSVRWDRREATRCATRWELICHIGGSAGRGAPRPMGRTA
jgi:hypothetical protein